MDEAQLTPRERSESGDPWVEVNRLYKLTPPALDRYVFLRLTNQVLNPPADVTHGEYPESFIADAYKLSREENPFNQRLRAVVRGQLIRWEEGLIEKQEAAEYGQRLLYLAGVTHIEDGPEIVERIAFESRTAALTVDDSGLDQYALLVLLDFPGQKDREGFWERLFEHPRHFDTAFWAFILRSPSEAITNMSGYLAKAREFNLSEGIVRFRMEILANSLYVVNPETDEIQGIDTENLEKLRETVKNLDPGQRPLMEDILISEFPQIVLD